MAFANGRSVIMVADDDPDIRSLISLQLDWEGYEAIEASDGEEALQLVRESEPDLILLDISMPKRDGYEVVRNLRSEGFKTPVIFLSAHAEESAVNRRMRGETYQHVTKPFVWGDVARIIGEVLAERGTAASGDDLAERGPADDHSGESVEFPRKALAGEHLVVVASSDAGALIRIAAEDLGAVVLTTEEAHEAVTLIADHERVAAVVLEVPSRRFDSAEFERIVSDRQPGLAVLRFSPFSHKALAAAGLAATDASVIHPPVEPADLLSAIASDRARRAA